MVNQIYSLKTNTPSSIKPNCNWLIIAALMLSFTGLNAQNIRKQVGKSNKNANQIWAINQAIKNGGNKVNAIDTIPVCSSYWAFVGASGVVPDNDPAGLTMNLPITDVVGTNMGTDVNLVGVYFHIQHFRIGDIKVELISPNGTSVLLVDRMGYPATLPWGCVGDNIDATFVRGTGAEAENVCSTTPPALGGVHSAVAGDNLNNINIAGGSPNGTWHLKVTDLANGEQAFVLAWQLFFDQQPPNAVFTINSIGLFTDLTAQNTLQGNATYTWSFGDGDSATGQHVIHEYPFRGSYTISLLVVDSCGWDTISGTFALETVPCIIEFPSLTTPTPITDNNPNGDTLTITPNTVIGYHLGKDVQLAKVCIKGTHPRTGDLKMKLISPGGVVIVLMDRPMYPVLPFGCTNADFDFCIIHGDSADNDDTCDPTGDAIKGDFSAWLPQDLKSVNDLVTSPNGTWKLVVYDMAPGFTGTVTSWSLYFDDQDPDPAYTYTFDGLTVSMTSKNLPLVNYHWDFGDGTPLDTNSSPTHTYATPGYKTVTVYTDNACGLDTLVRTIRMYACEEVHEYLNVPVAIPDNDSNGVTIPFTISGVNGNTLGVDAFITRVCITSDHPRTGDIWVKLKAPNTTQVTLLKRPLETIAIYGCLAGGVDMCVVEGSDNTTRFVCDYVNAPPAIKGFYTGLGNPLELINQNGGSPNGKWKLEVYDVAPLNVGNITSFKIYFGKFLPDAHFSYTMGASGQAAFTSPNVNTIAYSWDFGDGNTSTLDNPTHTYAANGIYTVKLIAVDSCITDSTTQTVYVTTYNNGCISGYDYTGSPAAIADADSVAGTVINLNLNNVNGTTLGGDVNLVKIAVQGQHTRVGDLKMKLIAPNGAETILFDRPGYPATASGCTGSDFDFTIINGQGTSLENICKPVSPALDGTRTTPEGYDLGSVNFSGGNPNGNWQLVVYDYAVGEVGVVENVTLCFDNQLPKPDFNFSVSLNTTTFSVDPNPGANYSWSFGDGYFSSIDNPVHTYADTGSYTVTLVVTDTCGTDSLLQVVNILDVLQTCVTSYGDTSSVAIPDNDAAGTAININLSDVVGTSLGNDVSLVRVCINGIHANVGDLKMTLIAPNGISVDLMDRPGYPALPTGCTGDNFDVCFVKGLNAPIENSCDAGVPSLTGIFTAANGNDLLSINNAGGSPNGNWQLIVSDLSAGDTGTVNSVQLYFNNQPHTDASFTYNVSLNNIYFDVVNQTDASYIWSFGDGDSAFFADPSHSYAASGNYTVTLTVSDSCGENTSSQIITVTIYSEPACVKEFTFTGVPIIITNNHPSGEDASFNVSGVTGSTLGSDVNLVKVRITGLHDRVSDLIAKLTAPNGQVIILMDRPGFPATALGCTGDDFDFEVVRGINFDVEDICALTVPTIQGIYTATNGEDLDNVNIAGGNPNGLWTLNMSDNAAGGFGGELTGFQLYFDNQPQADASFAYNIVGNAVDFTSANVSGVSYLWSFGGGVTSTDANPVYSFPLTGSYPVTLVASDSCGSDSTSQTITVVTYSEPTCTSTISFAGTPVNIPDNDSIGYTLPLNVTGISGSALGSDVSLVSACLTGLITNVGDIKATLIAPNGATVDLIDRPGYPSLPAGCPNADFDFCIVRGVGNSVENSCSSLPPAVGGEHTAMAGFNLDSINIAGGSPNGLWQLIVYDLNAGALCQLTGAQLIFDNQPQADATFSFVANGYDVTFNSQNQTGINYSWSFGDNNASTDANPVHTYLSNGSYTITLTAGDSCGSVITTQSLVINEIPTCTRYYVCDTIPVNIPDNDSTGVTSLYTLNNVTGNNLGTDVRLTNVCVAGTHTNVGDLIIKLTAPNGKEITLMDRPGYPATATGCSGDDFDFCITGGINFDNENICNPVAPAISGSYSAVNDNLDSINYYGGNPNGNWSLTISDNNAVETGSLTSWKMQFNAQPPVADFTYTVNGYTVNFFGPSIPNALYSWNFGDTVTANTQNPIHVYTQSGTYLVVLTVSDSCGTTISSQLIPITVGIDELGGVTSMQMIPNPASNFVDIKISNKNALQLKLKVLNSLGELVYQNNISKNEKSISRHLDCSKWSKGIYTVELSDPKNTQQMKLVIQ
ncbi:MAG: PKD domain-containing protein [Bacteroidia bacterium]